MKDNGLIALLRTQLLAASSAAGWPDVEVIQKLQPSQQGTPSGRTIFIQKLFDKRYGFAGQSLDYDESSDTIRQTEIQCIETTIQISALARQNGDDTLPTASDIINYSAQYLSTEASVDLLASNGVNIIRITDVRNVSFSDDQFRNEFHSSFDVTLSHSRDIVFDVSKVASITGDIIDIDEV